MNQELTENNPEVLPSETSVELMPRADGLAIWSEFRAQAEKLKATAETLTVTDVNDKAGMMLARTTRLALRDVRLLIRDKHKEMKEEFLVKGRKVDGFKNELFEIIEPLEVRLKEQEEFAERVEAARIAAIANDRKTALLQFTEAIPDGLGTMPDAQFTDMLEGARLVHEAKLERERLAEESRLAQIEADRVERERIQAENAKLKAEAEAKGKQLAEERQKANEEAAKIKAEAAERERIIQARAIESQRIADEATRAQAAKVAALQKAESDRLAEIAKKEAAAKKAADAAAKAPDQKKLTAFAAEVRAIALPVIADTAASEKLATTRERFAAFVEDLASKL